MTLNEAKDKIKGVCFSHLHDLNKEVEALTEEPEDNPTKKALKLEIKELSEAAHILMQHFSNSVDDGK